MLTNYIKIAIKVLQRRKFFTFISLFGISFTLLVLNVLTAFLDSFISPGGPEQKLDRTIILENVMIKGKAGTSSTDASYYFINRYVKPLKTAEKISIFSNSKIVTTYQNNRKVKTAVKYTDSEYWAILEFNFLEGKPYSYIDVKESKQVAVISKNLQNEYFQGKSALGKFVELGENKFQVIGVIDDVSVTRFRAFADIYIPVSTSKQDFQRLSFHGDYQAMVLVPESREIEEVRSEFLRNLNYVEYPNPDRYNEIVVKFLTQSEQFASMDGELDISYARTILIAVIFVSLFILLPTINLVNLNVTRIMERSTEIGVRKAFGATKIRLVSQFITENIILTFIGSFIAFFLTLLVIYLINTSGFSPIGTGSFNLEFNARVFLVSILVAIFFGLFSGVYPAFRMAKLNPVETLRGAQS